jgi:hypothetical protein
MSSFLSFEAAILPDFFLVVKRFFLTFFLGFLLKILGSFTAYSLGQIEAEHDSQKTSSCV